jgi:hypothetical protein
MTVSFRSIDIDKEFVRSYLPTALRELGYSARVTASGGLEDNLEVEDGLFHVEYKNLVYPRGVSYSEYMDIAEYMAAIESKKGKTFTLGSMNASPASNGLDVTVKPNGEIYFYGAECWGPVGNIHTDHLSMDGLIECVTEDPFLGKLYSTPFETVISQLRKNPQVNKKIGEINNPYWVLKELYREYPGIVSEVMAA